MREIFVALPSQGMDSLSLNISTKDCQEILTAWTAVYHPEVIRLTQKTAKPLYGLYVYEEPENAILITPSPTLDILDSYWMERAENRNCLFLKDCSSLDGLVAELLGILRREAEEEKAEKRDSVEGGVEEDVEENLEECGVTESGASSPTSELAEASETSETQNASDAQGAMDSVKSAPWDNPEAPQIEDFLALGMTYLLSEIMAHKLQFMSYLDSSTFSSGVLAVLNAMDSGDATKARREMQNVWDQLVQARQYYAPQDGSLFDLTLLDREYLPETFKEELETASKMNLLADASVIEKMAQKYPEMLEELKRKLDSKDVCLVGGEEMETEFPLLTQEGIIRRLIHGRRVYERYLGRTPGIFGRRKYGLTPLLPGVLKRLGFQGALHFTLDDGKFPLAEQSRIAWQGSDKQAVEAISKTPLDAQNADSVATLPENLAKVLNIDNSFGAVFTHWAGEDMTCVWYRLLKRSCRWIPLFGDLVTFEECFESTKYSSSDEFFSPERYVSPYLIQYVSRKEADPISRWTRYHQLRARLEALSSLENLTVWLKAVPAESEDASWGERALERLDSTAFVTKDFFTTAWQETLLRERKTAEKISSVLSDGTRKNALLLLNPMSFSVSKTTDLSEAEKILSVSRLIPAETDPVKKHFWEKNATDSRTPLHAARVDVPSLGFAILTDDPAQPDSPDAEKKSTKRWFLGASSKERTLPPPVYQDRESGMWIMANERLTLRFDPFTGRLRSVFDNIHRGNRFSQLLAMRLKASSLDSIQNESPDEYSIMAADSFKPAIYADRSEIEISGRLMDRNGEIVARFTQTTTLRRGSRIVEFDVFLEPLRELGRNPWQSYVANRIAWGDSAVDIFRNVGFHTQLTRASKIEAPYFVNIRSVQYSASTKIFSTVSQEIAERIRGRELRKEDFLPERGNDTEYSDSSITFLANGLPWHRSCGGRRLDSLLLVQGETGRRFRFGVAVDVPYPTRTAMEFMTPISQVPVALKSPQNAPLSGWFGHVSHRNVLATHWEAEENGARIRFAETEGRKVRVAFRAIRPLDSAEQIDFNGERLNTFAIEDDSVKFDLYANEFKELRIKFKKD